MFVRWFLKLRARLHDFLFPEDQVAAQVRIESLRIIAGNGRISLLFVPFMAVMLTASNLIWAKPAGAFAWVAAIFVAAGVDGIVFRHFLDSEQRPEDAGQWTLVCIAGLLPLNIVWPLMVAVIWTPTDVANNAYITSFLCASLAVTITIYGPVLPISILCPFIYVPILMTHASTAANSMSLLGPINLAGYGLLMGGLAWTIAQSATTGIRLKLQNEMLAKDLASAHEMSERARRQAEEASRAKSEFLASMSHDLRTPLNAIMGFSDLMLQGTYGSIVPAKYAGYVRHIHQSGAHLLNLINDILDVSKIEAGRRELERREIRLGNVVRESLGFVEMQAQKAGVIVRVDVSPSAALHSDERALVQILTNLLSNAVKFTRAGGTVTVFARHQPDGTLTLGVEDTGIGIAPEDMAKVLEPFAQVNHYVSIEGHGTGLGLPIVKGLTEAIGGIFRIESRLGVGTRAWSEFPQSLVAIPRAIA